MASPNHMQLVTTGWSKIPIKQWTTDNLANWVNSLTGLSDKWKNLIVGPIRENGVTGDEFYPVKNGQQLADSFDIKNRLVCNKVMKSFNSLKKKRFEDAISAAAANNPTDVTDKKDDNDVQRFQLQLIAQGKYCELDEWVTYETLVKEVKAFYKIQSGVKAEIHEIDLYYLSKAMDANKSLGDYNLDIDHHLISVKFDAVGGSVQRQRIIKFTKYGLIKSNKPDCLIGYDDDDGIGRAEIGCAAKHAMAANTMFQYIVQVLQSNMNVTTIHCPKCKALLDWNKCAKIADMNSQEYAQWTNVIQKRKKSGKTRPCPNCSADCARKKGVVIFRMSCSACKAYDWCWVCAKKWKGSGFTYCGNDQCKLVKETNDILSSADIITPKYLKDVKIPNIRACPMCLTLIKHKKDCKHMTCPGCSKKFCFVCLSIKTAKGWPCNQFNDECTAAPKQRFI